MVKETKQKQQKKAVPSKPINKKAKLSTESEKKSKSKRAQKQQQQQLIEEPVIEEEEKVEVVEEEDPQEEMYDDDDNDDDGEELTFKKDGFMTIGENDDIDAVIAAIRAEDGDSESDEDDDGIIRDVEVKKGDENDYEDDNDDNDDVNMDNGDDNDDFLEEELNDDVSKHEENEEEEAKLRAKKKEERAMNIEKLKEEERLYKSHLFKLQIDELIKGCTPAYDGESGIATRFTSWLEGTFVPGLKGFAQKDVFVPIGSFASRMMTLHKDKRITIDVAVKIPDTAFDAEQQSDPSKNKKQSKKPKAKPKSYEFLKGDYMSKFAAAVEKGFGKVTSKMTSINGHYIFTTKDFDVAFYPAISKEVAAKYAAEAPAATAKDFLCAESAAFLRKCTVGCRGLRDAAVLVKVWLHQRSMDVLPDSLGSFALALVLGMLTEESRSNRQMTSYQLFVLAMETFGSGRVASPMMDPVLHKVDILAHMTRQSMLELQQEAKATVECLQTSITPEGGFPEVFLTKIDPAWKYDCIINVDPAKTKTTAGEIVDLLLRAVGRRCFVIREIPELGHAAVGLVLDPSECTKCVERGPSADDNEGSKVFCDIWKSKAEVRRFKDGSIVQSVVFDVDDDGQRHTIMKSMCSFLLKEHFGIKERDINFSCTELDGIIPGEEKSIRLVSDFDALAKKMKELSLPLRIRDVLPTSPALRYTAACVPEPIARNGLKGGQTYIAPITGVIRFEASTSWPTDDEDAIQKVKTALLVKLSEALQTTYMIDSFPYDDHIEVIFKGVVYSLCVHHPREITLYRTIDPARAEAMSRECVQAPLHHSALHSTAVRFHAFTKTVRLAKRWLSAHLFSDHIAEETVELLVASLFVGHAPERAPQTHTAGLYRFLALLASFAPADLPAFVLADLGSGGGSGSDLTQGNYKSAVGQMNHLKAKSPGEAGGLFVVSSYARARNVWAVPAPVVMRRIIAFARKCAEMLRGFILSPKHIPATEWRAIFNHSMDDYDIVVALDPYKLPTLPLALPWQASEAALAKLAAREAVAVKRARRLEQLAEGMAVPPLVGFDPSALLCDALRKSYGSKALFFRNALGGEAVGIVWRPGSLAPHKWSPKDMLSVMPADDDNDKKKMKKGELGSDIVQINVPEFVRDIEIIGSGLVKSVSTKKDTKQ